MEVKKTMRFDYLLLAFLVIAAFIIGGSLMIADFNKNYSDIIKENLSESEFDDTYNTINDIYSMTSEVKNATIDSDISTTTSWETMSVGAYSALRIIPKTFSLFNQITISIAKKMGISCGGSGEGKVCIFLDLAFIAFIILVFFSIIYTIFRFIPK